MDTQKKLLALKKLGEENNIPNISFDNAHYLTEIIRKNNYNNILEIGTANGFSTINFALTLQDLGGDGRITTIEFSPLPRLDAIHNFEDFGVADMIDSRLGNALDILPTLEEKYDFIFIDGMKKRSLDFYLLVRDKLADGGCIVIDDVIKFRYKMESLYEYLENQQIAYELVHVDVDDGIMIFKK